MSNPKTSLVLYAIGLFVLGAVVALGGEHLFFKRTDPRDSMRTMEAFQDWQLTCSPRTDKNGGCELATAIFDRATRAPLVRLTVNQKGADETLAVVTPLGVLIPPGVRLSIGSAQPRLLAFRTCVQGGCVAILPLNSDLTSEMARNTLGKIVVVNAAGKAVALNYSLNGFADAMAARAVDMAARTGR